MQKKKQKKRKKKKGKIKNEEAHTLTHPTADADVVAEEEEEEKEEEGGDDDDDDDDDDGERGDEKERKKKKENEFFFLCCGGAAALEEIKLNDRVIKWIWKLGVAGDGADGERGAWVCRVGGPRPPLAEGPRQSVRLDAPLPLNGVRNDFGLSCRLVGRL